MQNGLSNGDSNVTNVDALVVGAGFSGIAMLVSRCSHPPTLKLTCY